MNARTEDSAWVVDCRGEDLVCVLHRPEHPASTGVLIVTGGPQYRVGSHRQFVLLGRALAAAGFAALRFDYRGMGDSSGEPPGFDRVDDDIRAAIDSMFARVDGLDGVVIWGLCDAASAAMIYGATDARVQGLVLLNPWARTEAGQAKTLLTHYYLQRLLSGGFWRKLLSGKLALGRTLRSLAGNVRKASADPGRDEPQGSYLERMERGLARFPGPCLLVISGEDLTAAEFLGYAEASASWRRLLGRPGCTRVDLAGANHTFSSAAWRAEVEEATIRWLKSLAASP